VLPSVWLVLPLSSTLAGGEIGRSGRFWEVGRGAAPSSVEGLIGDGATKGREGEGGGCGVMTE
jgi:hypothetical protein